MQSFPIASRRCFAALITMLMLLAVAPDRAWAGACCSGLGSCTTVTSSANCVGTFLANETCTPNPCPGACCDGSVCHISANNVACFSGGGSFQGINTTCSPNVCAGSCCRPDNPTTCIVTSKTSCSSGSNLIIFTAGQTCAAAACPVSGACCFTASGICVLRFAQHCNGAGQAFTPSTACGPVVCPTDGACCRNAECVVVASSGECGATFTFGATCSPELCPPPGAGACCRVGSCSIALEADCGSDAEHIFLGVGVPCLPSRCCPGDFNRSASLSVQDIFDFLAAYFGGDPRADFNFSGVISVQDIFDFLAAYFAGCL